MTSRGPYGSINDRAGFLAEIRDLHEAGRTRAEARQVFNGRRKRAWVLDTFPRHISIVRLHAMHRRGLSLVRAIKEFGVENEHWCRVHWPTIKPNPIQQIYADQNIVPSIRRIAVERGGKAWHTAG